VRCLTCSTHHLEVLQIYDHSMQCDGHLSDFAARTRFRVTPAGGLPRTPQNSAAQLALSLSSTLTNIDLRSCYIWQPQPAALPRLRLSITQLLQSRTCGFVVLIQLPRAIQLERPDQAASSSIVGQVAAEPQPQPLAEAQAL
jgi:hypothetical protein